MTPDELAERVYKFAIRVLQFCGSLPRTPEADIIRNQLGRAATGMSGNYRAVPCARSRAEFVAKLGTVHEEADESFHWLRLSRDASIAARGTADDLVDEAHALQRIFAKPYATARARYRAEQAHITKKPNRATTTSRDDQTAK